MEIWNKIKIWFCRVILGRQMIYGIDFAKGKDFSCEVKGYKNRKGIYKIKTIKYLK